VAAATALLPSSSAALLPRAGFFSSTAWQAASARTDGLSALRFLDDSANHPRDSAPRLDARCFLTGNSAGDSSEEDGDGSCSPSGAEVWVTATAPFLRHDERRTKNTSPVYNIDWRSIERLWYQFFYPF
jgi:hypothetical protein